MIVWLHWNVPPDIYDYVVIDTWKEQTILRGEKIFKLMARVLTKVLITKIELL